VQQKYKASFDVTDFQVIAVLLVSIFQLAERCSLVCNKPVSDGHVHTITHPHSQNPERKTEWFGHVKTVDANRLPTKVLHCNIKGKRNRGRQPKTWIDNTKEDLKARNMQWR